LPAHEVVEDHVDDAILVRVVEQHWRDLLQPRAWPDLLECLVFEKQQELDIRIGIALAPRERAVHHQRVEPLICGRNGAHACYQLFLWEHRALSCGEPPAEVYGLARAGLRCGVGTPPLNDLSSL